MTSIQLIFIVSIILFIVICCNESIRFLKYPQHVLITFTLQSQIINHNIYINSSPHNLQWVSYKYHDKRKSPINGLFTSFMKLCLLFKLGKSKDIIKHICLNFVSFFPLFYFSCIYYWGSLIFCCQFVARTFIFDYFGLYPSFLVISLMHQNSAFPFVDSPSTYS